MVKDPKGRNKCPFCERLWVFHTAEERADCKETLALLERLRHSSVQGIQLQEDINE
jgi:predicted neuraminidase